MTYVIIALISILIILNIILLIVFIANKNNNNENNNLKLYLKDEYNNLKIDLLKLTKEANTNNTEAIIKSMTKKERLNPSIINGSRRKRIASGSGTSVQKVNALLKQYEEMKKMMKKFSTMGMGKKKGGFGNFKMPF